MFGLNFDSVPVSFSFCPIEVKESEKKEKNSDDLIPNREMNR